MKAGGKEKMTPLFWLHWLLGLRILAKVAIRYVSRYMPRDYDINRDTM